MSTDSQVTPYYGAACASRVLLKDELQAMQDNIDGKTKGLAQLEAQHDEFAEAQADLPSSDELAAEVERFLQSQTDDDSGDSAD